MGKKLLIIGGGIVIVLFVVLSATGILQVTPTASFWLDEGDPGFEKSVDVKKILNQTISGKNYTLRYYKKHSDPNLVNSLYIQYVDPDFSMANTKKYADTTSGSGEFSVLGHALCQDTQLRTALGYQAITFHVTSAASGVKEYLENTWTCP